MITRNSWGSMPDGRTVDLFTLTNAQGMTASITSYGAILVGLTAPDRNGTMADVVLGYDTVDEYINGRGYFGAVVGRVANRVSHGQFELDGVLHKLPRNKEKFQMHGGATGFHSRLWEAEAEKTMEGPAVTLRYRSADGEEGYPGNLDAEVVYLMTGAGLRMTCRARTDKPTVVTMTNHAYFNLSGDPGSDILDHVLTLNASRYLPTDNDQIPTGAVHDVAGTPFDFSRPKAIGLHIDADHEAIGIGQGYDHYFILDGDIGEMTPAAQIFHGGSGRVLEVCTTQPGLQFYSGNHMADRINGKLGVMYGYRSGFCIETQAYVDAPNRPEFPAITLRPGERYEQITEYRLSGK
ncbi:aldose epimerase family protein [Pseudodesulfovibrio piezophilus]|uniref:Aldose 1-epimerase n=1 Tax=Pseudodesulfovibrio piezophilus (strain DSM 21447 / JCM 15486 / C1TLV30) TaxID=1322246 RepID=M1WVW8_PSEP2|nr:aldose epimerase family protein [Pseudodesulfovibrio piezophilus]CCH48783.1 Aldose 1-epimerase [Pseudodesulfovibrio piezophilus C1TLV30]